MLGATSEQRPIQGAKFTPVCAIGESAGGIAALQSLFRLMPADLSLAYVVILHLAPDHPSTLHEILGACTSTSVLQVTGNPTLKPHCVYVIPPDRELMIDGDTITARPLSEPHGKRAPINMIFRCIAAARGDGIAIVLTGAGADGAIGVRAIKEAGGIIFVQEPSEAAFPRCRRTPSPPGRRLRGGACAAGRAHRRSSKEAARSLDLDGEANELRRIITFLRARTGHHFSS